MYMPSNTGTDFAPPPEGTHAAVCYRLIDLGTQPIEWQGQKKFQRKIMLSWELSDERMEDGRPFSVSQRYTYSSSDRSRLRQDLEAWRGKRFTDAELGPGGFDIKNVLGAACLLSILHNQKEGRTYANITSLSRLPKGMAAPTLVNPKVYFSLETFDKVLFESLSEGLKNVIKVSPEYVEAVTPRQDRHLSDEPPPRTSEYADEFNDPVPF